MPARGAEIVRDEAEGDARADGVYTYSEVGARPDNEVRKPLKRRGFRSGNFCPRGIAEVKLRKTRRKKTPAPTAYFAYVEVGAFSTTKYYGVLAREVRRHGNLSL